MPVPTIRKRSRRALINAGQPVAHYLQFNTSQRQEVAACLGNLMLPTYSSGLPVRASVSKSFYRYRLGLVRLGRTEAYAAAQQGGERNIFA